MSEEMVVAVSFHEGTFTRILAIQDEAGETYYEFVQAVEDGPEFRSQGRFKTLNEAIGASIEKQGGGQGDPFDTVSTDDNDFLALNTLLATTSPGHEIETYIQACAHMAAIVQGIRAAQTTAERLPGDFAVIAHKLKKIPGRNDDAIRTLNALGELMLAQTKALILVYERDRDILDVFIDQFANK